MVTYTNSNIIDKERTQKLTLNRGLSNFKTVSMLVTSTLHVVRVILPRDWQQETGWLSQHSGACMGELAQLECGSIPSLVIKQMTNLAWRLSAILTTLSTRSLG